MIQVRELTKLFGDTRAVDGISFDIKSGEILGLLGPNGAGKTTTMRIVMGVLSPDAGHVTFGGAELTLALRSRFGYMPEERGLYPRMRVAEQLVFLGQVHGLDTAAARRHVDGLLTTLDLHHHADDLLQTLSLGNQQRVQVAAALVHDPTVLVLDEPFSGLDPLAVDELGAMLRDRTAPDRRRYILWRFRPGQRLGRGSWIEGEERSDEREQREGQTREAEGQGGAVHGKPPRYAVNPRSHGSLARTSSPIRRRSNVHRRSEHLRSRNRHGRH